MGVEVLSDRVLPWCGSNEGRSCKGAEFKELVLRRPRGWQRSV